MSGLVSDSGTGGTFYPTGLGYIPGVDGATVTVPGEWKKAGVTNPGGGTLNVKAAEDSVTIGTVSAWEPPIGSVASGDVSSTPALYSNVVFDAWYSEDEWDYYENPTGGPSAFAPVIDLTDGGTPPGPDALLLLTLTWRTTTWTGSTPEKWGDATFDPATDGPPGWTLISTVWHDQTGWTVNADAYAGTRSAVYRARMGDLPSTTITVAWSAYGAAMVSAFDGIPHDTSISLTWTNNQNGSGSSYPQVAFTAADKLGVVMRCGYDPGYLPDYPGALVSHGFSTYEAAYQGSGSVNHRASMVARVVFGDVPLKGEQYNLVPGQMPPIAVPLKETAWSGGVTSSTGYPLLHPAVGLQLKNPTFVRGSYQNADTTPAMRSLVAGTCIIAESGGTITAVLYTDTYTPVPVEAANSTWFAVEVTVQCANGTGTIAVDYLLSGVVVHTGTAAVPPTPTVIRIPFEGPEHLYDQRAALSFRLRVTSGEVRIGHTALLFGFPVGSAWFSDEITPPPVTAVKPFGFERPWGTRLMGQGSRKWTWDYDEPGTAFPYGEDPTPTNGFDSSLFWGDQGRFQYRTATLVLVNGIPHTRVHYEYERHCTSLVWDSFMQISDVPQVTSNLYTEGALGYAFIRDDGRIGAHDSVDYRWARQSPSARMAMMGEEKGELISGIDMRFYFENVQAKNWLGQPVDTPMPELALWRPPRSHLQVTPVINDVQPLPDTDTYEKHIANGSLHPTPASLASGATVDAVFGTGGNQIRDAPTVYPEDAQVPYVIVWAYGPSPNDLRWFDYDNGVERWDYGRFQTPRGDWARLTMTWQPKPFRYFFKALGWNRNTGPDLPVEVPGGGGATTTVSGEWHTCDNNEPPPPGRPAGDGGVEDGWAHVSWMRRKDLGPGSGRTGRLKIALGDIPVVVEPPPLPPLWDLEDQPVTFGPWQESQQAISMGVNSGIGWGWTRWMYSIGGHVGGMCHSNPFSTLGRGTGFESKMTREAHWPLPLGTPGLEWVESTQIAALTVSAADIVDYPVGPTYAQIQAAMAGGAIGFQYEDRPDLFRVFTGETWPQNLDEYGQGQGVRTPALSDVTFEVSLPTFYDSSNGYVSLHVTVVVASNLSVVPGHREFPDLSVLATSWSTGTSLGSFYAGETFTASFSASSLNNQWGAGVIMLVPTRLFTLQDLSTSPSGAHWYAQENCRISTGDPSYYVRAVYSGRRWRYVYGGPITGPTSPAGRSGLLAGPWVTVPALNQYA